MTRESCIGFGFDAVRDPARGYPQRGGPGTRLVPDDQGPDLQRAAKAWKPAGGLACRSTLTAAELGRPDDCRDCRGPCHAPANGSKRSPLPGTLGNSGLLPLPGSVEPRRCPGSLSIGRRLGCVSPPDPSLCPALSGRNTQPCPGRSRAEPRRWRRPILRVRGDLDRTHVAEGGNRSRSLAGLQRLVAGVRSGPRG